MTTKTKPVTHKLDMSPSLRDPFNAMRIAIGFEGTQPEFLLYLITNCPTSNLFGEKDLEKINAAADAAKMSFASIVVSGTLQYADRILDATSDGKTPKADIKIHDYVTALINSNDKAVEWFEKVEITQGEISKTGCNRENIKRYLAANRQRIDEHHAKHKIEKDHNRRVANRQRVLDNAKTDV